MDIKLPPGAGDPIFEEAFVRGAVLSTEMQFRTGERKQKFLILLNKQTTDADSLFFLITSQTAFYDKYPYGDHIRIEADTLPFFPLATVINCREVFPLLRTDLKKRYREGVLRFVGLLPLEILGRIDQIVASSRLISQRHKKAILGWK